MAVCENSQNFASNICLTTSWPSTVFKGFYSILSDTNESIKVWRRGAHPPTSPVHPIFHRFSISPFPFFLQNAPSSRLHVLATANAALSPLVRRTYKSSHGNFYLNGTKIRLTSMDYKVGEVWGEGENVFVWRLRCRSFFLFCIFLLFPVVGFCMMDFFLYMYVCVL